MILTSESIALAKLKEVHQEEYDFYVEHAMKKNVSDWKDLPSYPVKLQAFCLADYISAALDRAVYEPDGEVIFARVPDVDAFYFTQKHMKRREIYKTP